MLVRFVCLLFSEILKLRSKLSHSTREFCCANSVLCEQTLSFLTRIEVPFQQHPYLPISIIHILGCRWWRFGELWWTRHKVTVGSLSKTKNCFGVQLFGKIKNKIFRTCEQIEVIKCFGTQLFRTRSFNERFDMKVTCDSDLWSSLDTLLSSAFSSFPTPDTTRQTFLSSSHVCCYDVAWENVFERLSLCDDCIWTL